MKSLLEAGARLQQMLSSHGWRFCYIGGVANYRWGTPRLTSDLDLTLLTGFGEEDRFVLVLLDLFRSRIGDPVSFAKENRVLLLRTDEGINVDVALGAMPFEERSIARSSTSEIVPGASLRTCSAEDLIVYKSFASRPQDWVDVEGVILRQSGKLNWAQIWLELDELATLKGSPELLAQLEHVAHRTEQVIGAFPRSR
ncbi:MAG: hypothetical protein ACT4OZ_09850 [Gemmatimonadota bacterium]